MDWYKYTTEYKDIVKRAHKTIVKEIDIPISKQHVVHTIVRIRMPITEREEMDEILLNARFEVWYNELLNLSQKNGYIPKE